MLMPGVAPPPGFTFIGITTVALRKAGEGPGPVAAHVYQKD